MKMLRKPLKIIAIIVTIAILNTPILYAKLELKNTLRVNVGQEDLHKRIAEVIGSYKEQQSDFYVSSPTEARLNSVLDLDRRLEPLRSGIPLSQAQPVAQIIFGRSI